MTYYDYLLIQLLSYQIGYDTLKKYGYIDKLDKKEKEKNV